MPLVAKRANEFVNELSDLFDAINDLQHASKLDEWALTRTSKTVGEKLAAKRPSAAKNKFGVMGLGTAFNVRDYDQPDDPPKIIVFRTKRSVDGKLLNLIREVSGRFQG